jgi:hypothetical protein
MCQDIEVCPRNSDSFCGKTIEEKLHSIPTVDTVQTAGEKVKITMCTGCKATGPTMENCFKCFSEYLSEHSLK